MNTNPDEASLALWLDDELAGGDLVSVEAWAMARPEQIDARTEVRRWRAMMARAIPASEEPPFPEFFNSRVMQAVRDQSPKKTDMAEKKPASWYSWLMPLVACAGMVVAFLVGKQSVVPREYDVKNAPKAIPVEPVVYTPESGVEAKWYASKEASATVIVLNGVAAIPDDKDFSETVDTPMDREIDSTAESDVHPPVEVGP